MNNIEKLKDIVLGLKCIAADLTKITQDLEEPKQIITIPPDGATKPTGQWAKYFDPDYNSWVYDEILHVKRIKPSEYISYPDAKWLQYKYVLNTDKGIFTKRFGKKAGKPLGSTSRTYIPVIEIEGIVYPLWEIVNLWAWDSVPTFADFEDYNPHNFRKGNFNPSDSHVYRNSQHYP